MMGARLLPTCVAEIHFPEEGVGRRCSLAVGHPGSHWGMRPIGQGGYTPISWEGDDRAPEDGA